MTGPVKEAGGKRAENPENLDDTKLKSHILLLHWRLLSVPKLAALPVVTLRFGFEVCLLAGCSAAILTGFMFRDMALIPAAKT